MKFYTKVILYGAFLIFTMDLIVCQYTHDLAWWCIGLWVIGGIALALVIDLIIVVTIFVLLPKKIFNPFSRLFKTFGFEKRFFNFVHIKSWKDIIPAGIGFKKDKIYDMSNNEYVFAFLRDNCMAEIDHSLSLIFGLLLFVIIPIKYVWYITLPVFVVHTILHAMPVLVQRYNRPRVLVLYMKNKRDQERLTRQDNN